LSKSWNRPQTWLALIVVGVSGLITALAGLHLYVTATAVPVHPDALRIPSVGGTAAAAKWAAAADRGRTAVRAAVAERNLAGLSVAVGVDGEIVWAEGFGWANVESRKPVEPDTRFRIGTASTVLTSAAVGRLLDQHRLDLDAEIQAYVPEFPKKPRPVTLRQVLAHTAGLGNDGGDESPLFAYHCERPFEALELFWDDDLRFDPGTRFRYSRYGWILASAALEKAAGEGFPAVMRRQVFEPLGMRDTALESVKDPIPNRATSYFPRYAADPRYGLDVMRDLDTSCYAGSAAFLSTASDLVRFGMGVNRGTLLQPATVQLLQTSQRLPSGQETGYGLGWDLETVTLAGAPAQAVGHDGDLLGGVTASLMTFRDRGLVVAVISNTSYADTPAIALKVADAFAAR
jgi:serine beta-lactamase-like protein LACTB, mitochondrial